jgi:uncharacterized membrane protein YqjE
MAQQASSDDLKERSLPELLKQLSQETATLVRQEIDLAKAEVSERGKKAGLGLGMFGAAGVTALLALMAFTAFLILLLAEAVDGWVAALIVTVVYGAVAAVLGLQGKEKVKEATPPAPQTVETVKEDIEWAKHPTTSGKR